MSSYQCEICGIEIRGSSDKAIKQHLKSRPHRDRAAQRSTAQHAQETLQNVEELNEGKISCSYCEFLGRTKLQDTFYIHRPDQEKVPSSNYQPAWYCLAPTFVPGMIRHKEFMDTYYKHSLPFVTTCSASLTYGDSDAEDAAVGLQAPNQLDEFLDYVSSSWGGRVPNIDIDGKNVHVSSHKEAARILIQAHQQGLSYWASYETKELVIDPPWMPNRSKDMNSSVFVPSYTNIIVSSKQNTGIGIHQDVDHTQFKGRWIHSYLTLAYGHKRVILFPPNEKDFANQWKDKEFPHNPKPELVQEIKARGGYYFDLDTGNEPVPSGSGSDSCGSDGDSNHDEPKPMLTLYIPAGWYHWLTGMSEWTLVFGNSIY